MYILFVCVRKANSNVCCITKVSTRTKGGKLLDLLLGKSQSKTFMPEGDSTRFKEIQESGRKHESAQLSQASILTLIVNQFPVLAPEILNLDFEQSLI